MFVVVVCVYLCLSVMRKCIHPYLCTVFCVCGVKFLLLCCCVYICLSPPPPTHTQENVLDTGTEWRTKFFERVLKIRDPFDPQIPEEFETHHYLTAPFKKDQKEL